MWGAAPYNRRVVLLLGLFAAIVLGCVQGAGAVLTPAGSSATGAAPPQATVDSQAPTSPSNLTVTAVTTSSISLSWSTATDNVGVTGYGRYLSGYLINSGTLTRFTWTGLKCGTNYALAVDATDAAGNRSAPASLTASTTSCGPDTTSPSSVGNLQFSSATQTTIALGWLPATDNVGVAGYNLYVNGTKVGSTTNTSYTFTGLACGSAYSLAIETFDAAGNVSNRSLTTTSQSTTPCDQPTTPTGPAVMVGNATIEAQADSSPAGEAEAAVTTAASTGQVNELRIYLDTPTSATTVKVGIYADAAGKPGARLSSGTITTPQKSTWNAAPIAPVSVSAGTKYWIAVLGIGGPVAYRDRCCGSGTPVQTNAGVLTELPATWTTGPYIGSAGPLSAYGTWNAATSPAPAPPAPAPPAPAPPSPTDTTPPTAPSGLSVSSGTATSLTLSWTASSDNVGVTGYGRYKNGTLISTTSGTSYTFTGLTCGTTYTLAVDATDAAGNRSTKTQTTAATTTCGDTQAPSTPTGLAVAAATPGSISISWAAATDNVAVIGYGHYQNGSLVSTSSGTSYTFSGLTCGTGYTLSVDATDAAGNRSTRAQITASTSPCATGPLVGDATVGPQADSSPAGEAEAAVMTAGASGQINELLVYLAPSNAAPTVKVGLYGDAVGRPGALLASGTVASVKNGAWNVASVAPVPVTAGKQYWIAVLGIGGTIAYRDRCCGSGTPVQTAAGVLTTMPSVWTTGSYTGNDGPLSAYGDWTGSAPPPTPSPDTAPPSTPTGLLVSNAAQTTVTLSWTAASDNVAVTGYGHYRNAGLVDSGSATSYAFGGLTCGTSYTLGVDAADAAGNRSSKATITASTGACSTTDTTPPSVPQGQTISGTTQTTITMAWTASSDNVAVAGYRALLNGNPAGTTTNLNYTYTGLSCGTTYTIALEAYDAAGNASDRTKAQGPATTAACTPTGDTQAPTTPTNLTTTSSTQTSISLSWTASNDNVAVTSYGHYRNAGLVDGGSATSYTFSGLTCGTSYTLAVDASDAAGNRSPKAQVTVSTSACTSPPSSANVYMSPSGSDANPCSQGWPCRTFDRAYRVASPGATVEVASGSYPGQTISPDSSKTSTSDVIFRPASGASVTVTGEIEANGAHFELRDMTINQINFPRSADDITLRNVINHGMWMQGPSNISIIGGEITCSTCDFHSHIQNGGSDSRPPTNILFDGVYFHDWASQAGEHTECLQILGGDRVTIRNSTFKNCATANGGLGATADLHISALGSPVTRNILIENNFFFRSGNTYAIQSGDYSNLDFRYNSIVGPILVGGGWGDGTPVEFVGNVMGFGNCQAPVTGAGPVAPFVYRYNTLQGGTCSTTDKNAAAGFIDANNNLHLATSAAAVNAGDSANYPATDIDGQARPMGSAPDAGADEAGATTPTPEPTPPPTPNSPPPPTPPTDTTPPSPVSGLHVSASSQTSVTYAWNPATDDVAVSGYNMSRDGVMVGSTSALSYTYNGLICGTTYTFAVQTYDSSGNTSALATNIASTSPCSGSSDTTPPTAPNNLAATSATSTSISVAWTASTDSVGVAGYGRYVNGALISSGPGTSYTFSGLNCATGYTLAVDAYDAAGNRSGKTQVTASTGACSTAPSTGAANLWVDTNGGTCTRSASPVSYSDAAACSSFDKAWDAASAGDTIRVKNGTYGVQHVSGNKTSETFIIGESKAGVVISGADSDCYATAGASTVFCADATHMTLQDATIDTNSDAGASAGSLICADDVAYRNVDVVGNWPDLYIGLSSAGCGGNRFHWNGGTWGDANPPPRDCSTPHGEIVWDQGKTDVTIEGVTFNKQTTAVGAGPYCGADNIPHLEFVRLEPNSDNFTLRNNVYMPGSEAGSGYIFVNNATTDNVKIIGNYFADNDSPNYWIQAGDSPCNWTIAYNTFSGNDGAYLGCTAITWIGNLGPANSYPGCSGTHIENVWQTTGSCGTDNFTTGSLGVGAGGHLQPGSIAIDAGGSTQCQSLTGGVDIDGRPRTGICDAGTDEFGN